VSSYNPFYSLYWLVTGKTLGGLTMKGESNRLDRMEALRLWTVGSAWFSGDHEKKGMIAPGKLADLAVLSSDYFSVPDDGIKRLESVLTLVGGKVVHASGEFATLAPPPLPISPGWAPAIGTSTTRNELPGSSSSTRSSVMAHAHTPGFWTCGCFAY